MTPRLRTAMVATGLISLLLSCTAPKTELTLVWTPAKALKSCRSPFLQDRGEAASLILAVERTLGTLIHSPPERKIDYGSETVLVARLKSSLEDFGQKLSSMGLTTEFFSYIQQNYQFYRTQAASVLFTGYYEPILRGSRRQSAAFPCPLYGRPDDLCLIDLSKYSFFQKYPDLPSQIRGRLSPEKKVVPYYSRQEIDSQSLLAGRNLEIVWIDNPIDLFFLHIQGSGLVELDDGTRMRVGYAEQNGHPFKPIGRVLLEKYGLKPEDLSMSAIRAWLQSHADQMADVLNTNPSYIFFAEVPQGPLGSLGAVLTPERSIATDNRLFPAGSLAFITYSEPEISGSRESKPAKETGRFVVNQDTGGAIRGPGRVDLFFGTGPEAGMAAGKMKQPGMLYFILKKSN